MTLDDYQKKAQATAVYPAVGDHAWIYPALGLAGEAGEIANKLKKIIRDNDGQLSTEARRVLKGELGDLLWYLSELARQLDLSLAEIAADNIVKLSSRKERSKLGGSGDER